VAASAEFTIVRTRGLYMLELTSGDAIGAGYFGGVGICIVTDKALAIGATAVPGPFTEDAWDGWLWHSYFDVRMVTATIADGVNAGGVRMVIPIDSKAMRIVHDDETIVGVTEVVESTNAALERQGSTRMLIKEA